MHDEDTLTIGLSVERHEPEKDDPDAKYIRGERDCCCTPGTLTACACLQALPSSARRVQKPPTDQAAALAVQASARAAS